MSSIRNICSYILLRLNEKNKFLKICTIRNNELAIAHNNQKCIQNDIRDTPWISSIALLLSIKNAQNVAIRAITQVSSIILYS